MSEQTKEFVGTVIQTFHVGQKGTKEKPNKKRKLYRIGDEFKHTNEKVFNSLIEKGRITKK